MNTPPIIDQPPEYHLGRRIALLAALFVLLVMFSLMLLFPLWDRFFDWLIAINVVAFLAFAYDKVLSQRSASRVDSEILLLLTLLCGALGAVIGLAMFRYQPRDRSFWRIFWLFALVTLLVILLYYWQLCPQCR